MAAWDCKSGLLRASIPDSWWHRALLLYAAVLGAYLALMALDLVMDTVRVLPHVFGSDLLEDSESFEGRAQLVGFYLGFSVIPLTAMVLTAVVASVIAIALKLEEDGLILSILLMWSGMVWSSVFLFPTTTQIHASLGLEWDYLRPPIVNADNLLTVGFLLLFPCMLRVSALFPERAIGGRPDLSTRMALLRQWSLSLKFPIIAGVFLTAGFWIAGTIERVGQVLLWVGLLMLVVPVGANLAAAAETAERAARWRIIWLGLLLFSLLLLPSAALFGATGTWGEEALWLTGLLFSLPLLLLALFAAFVVFGVGALDPRLAVERTALYSVLALGGVFGFGVLETAVTDYLIAAVGLPQGTGAMIAGGIMAVSFKPAHSFIEKMIHRLFGHVEPESEAQPTA